MRTLLGKLPGPKGVRGRGQEPGTLLAAVKPLNKRPWLVLVGIHRIPHRDSALPSLLLGIHGAPNLQGTSEVAASASGIQYVANEPQEGTQVSEMAGVLGGERRWSAVGHVVVCPDVH